MDLMNNIIYYFYATFTTLLKAPRNHGLWNKVEMLVGPQSSNMAIFLGTCKFTADVLPKTPIKNQDYAFYGLSGGCVSKLSKEGRLKQAVENLCEKEPLEEAVYSLCEKGRLEEAVDCLYYKDQLSPTDSDTYACLLQACIDTQSLAEGERVHNHMIRTGFDANVVLENALIDMYAKCRRMDSARQVFDRMSKQGLIPKMGKIAGRPQNGFSNLSVANVVSWNGMISGYAQDGQGEEAVKLFREMLLQGVKPDHFPYTSTLMACASMAVLEQGKQVHVHIIKTGFELAAFVGSALIDMYAKCGSIEDARKFFNSMSERNVVSWTAMITGCAHHGLGKEALELFKQMIQADMKPHNITMDGTTIFLLDRFQ